MARRFYVNKELEVGQTLVFEQEDFNHIINVLRFKVGEQLVICNGSEYEFIARLQNVEKRKCEFMIIEKNINNMEAKTQVDVFQALVKGEKFEFIAQKLTELGINAIIPFSSKFVQVKENTTRLNRLEKISIEAVKQCGRAKPLKIEEIKTFSQSLKMLEEYDIVLFAYEHCNQNFDYSLLKDYNGKKVAIVIGSEGGFSEDEENQLLQLKNIKEVSLGKRILRAETATIALSSVVMCALNEWKV